MGLNKCGFCEKKYVRKIDLRMHECNIHGIMPKPKEMRYACKFCERKFYSRSSYFAHLKTHRSKVEEKYFCGFCDLKCKSSRQLEIHHLQVHQVVDNDQVESIPSCSYCNKRFKTEIGLKIHTSYCPKNPRIDHHRPFKCRECPCQDKFKTSRSLIEHLEKQHGKVIKTLKYTFNSYIDFMRWKEEEQMNKSIKFRLCSTHISNQGKKFYYRCNRSGFFKSKSNGKRSLKKTGSCLINAICLCTITCMVPLSGKLEVQYINFHYGHEVNTSFLKPRQDRYFDKIKKKHTSKDFLASRKTRICSPTLVNDNSLGKIYASLEISRVKDSEDNCVSIDGIFEVKEENNNLSMQDIPTVHVVPQKQAEIEKSSTSEQSKTLLLEVINEFECLNEPENQRYLMQARKSISQLYSIILQAKENKKLHSQLSTSNELVTIPPQKIPGVPKHKRMRKNENNFNNVSPDPIADVVEGNVPPIFEGENDHDYCIKTEKLFAPEAILVSIKTH